MLASHLKRHIAELQVRCRYISDKCFRGEWGVSGKQLGRETERLPSTTFQFTIRRKLLSALAARETEDLE